MRSSIPGRHQHHARGIQGFEHADGHLAAASTLKALKGKLLTGPQHTANCIRQQCPAVAHSAYLTPLGSHRPQNHDVLQGFEHADGRLAAASTLKALIGKLPDRLQAQWAPLFYMPLVLGLVAEQDAACRHMLSAALGALLQVCLVSYAEI